MLALTNATGMLFCRVAADGLNVVLFIAISRIFGPEGVGVYAYGFAVAGFVYAMTILGIEQYGVREYQQASPVQRSPMIAELLGMQLGVGLLVLALLGLYLLVTSPDQATMLIICSLSVYQLSVAVTATLFVPAMAQQEMLRPAVLTLIARGGAFVLVSVTLWVAEIPLSSALLIFPLAGAVLVASAMSSARAHLDDLHVQLALPAIARAFRAMWSFATAEMLGQFLARASVIVLSLLLGARAAGVYATGLKFIELFFLPLWFTGVAAYPRLCQAFLTDRPGFSRLVARLLWATLIMTAGIALAMYFIVPHLLVLVLGAEYAGMENLIAAMAIIVLVFGPEMGLGRILLASRLHANRARAIGAGAVSCFALNLILVPEFGVRGAICATAAAYFIVVVWYALALRAAPSERVLRQTPASSQ